VREKVGIFDQSSFAKFELSGPDAAKALDWICANDVGKPVGRLTYTQTAQHARRHRMRSDRGAAGRGDVSTSSPARVSARMIPHWIRDPYRRRHSMPGCRRHRDFGTLSLMGPRARDVLAEVTDADVSNAAFPFGHVREIAIAGHTVRALRVTYVGELGWELHVPIAATLAMSSTR
jgi:glycine cleavage system aminomethyltransferase T